MPNAVKLNAATARIKNRNNFRMIAPPHGRAWSVHHEAIMRRNALAFVDVSVAFGLGVAGDLGVAVAFRRGVSSDVDMAVAFRRGVAGDIDVSIAFRGVIGESGAGHEQGGADQGEFERLHGSSP